ncbi:MAG TPA: branched-chain amino acid ABC transporter permease [Candidatus Anaerotruncus excrementipullorum]|uniref:Branched-chain amino acid ABC transporter permease n=1 Tax=Candidatus Anaerotruncus excrementipullorum TaxID=2838465 RepID=A0A9D1WQD1_9FIRM|nr:branched-chain amino acid ABC transporter permease [Candidatus Anaerotruncus excrementipullorum]
MFLQQIINGITVGSTYALVTIGFNMVYGVLELTNFAHSSFYMLGAYISLFTMTSLIGRVTPTGFFIGLLVSIIITGFLGALMDKLALEPIRKHNGAPISALLSTVGIQTAINNAILLIFGTVPVAFPDVFELGRFNIGENTVVQNIQVAIFVLAVVLMVGLSLLVYRTKLGSAMRAISQNTTAARVMGVDVNRVITLTFFIGTAVAAISGTLVGIYYQRVDTLMGNAVGLKSFAAAVLGGMGSVPGAMVGGFLIGIAETLYAAYVSSSSKDAIAFVILILILIVRPSGLFGQKSVNKV